MDRKGDLFVVGTRVDRKGELFVVGTRDSQMADIAHVLDLRRSEVHYAMGRASASSQGQPVDEEAVILDRDARQRVEKILYDEYLQEATTQDLTEWVWARAKQSAAERREQNERVSENDIYWRSMRSYWKTTVFNRYGGQVWLSTLIATGRVHKISVDIVNEIFAERIRNQARREPTDDMAPPSTVARASSQGQVRGVQHRKSFPNQLREKAKLADKQVGWNNQRWWQAHERGNLSWRDTEWYRSKGIYLQRVANTLWEQAMQASIERGVAFQGRDGLIVGTQEMGIVERSLQILRERIQTGEVTWPPS